MTITAKAPDEFDAIRVIVETLKPFASDDQHMILRWAQEKLGLTGTRPGGVSQVALPQAEAQGRISGEAHPHRYGDIRSFMDAKAPKSDNQFAAAVAYFYRFEATDEQKKDAITAEDLTTACRLVNRKRPAKPAQVLVNAHHQGLLDKGERGQYRINSVGENLVAMVLPNPNGSSAKRSSKKLPKRPAKKTAVSKTRKAKRSGK